MRFLREGLFLAVLILPGLARASAQELYGVAPRDLALAGAASALGDHYGAVYYDPAALADAKRLRLTALWQQSESHLEIDGRHARGVEPSRASSVGLVLPIPLRGSLADRVVVGVVMHSPQDQILRVYSRPAQEPQFVLLQNHAQIMGVFVGGSVRVHRSISVGAGTRLAANVRAEVDLKANERGVNNTSNGLLTTTATPILAVRWASGYEGSSEGSRGIPRWSAALVYRHRFRQVFATPATNDLGGLRQPTPGLKATTMFVPTQVVAGGAWQPGPWSATLDLAWKKWSEMPDPTAGLGKIPPSSAPFPAFHDTLTGRAGIERRLSVRRATLALRAGYGFEPSPAPSMDDDYNLFDNDRHIVGAGFGVAWPWREGRIRLDAGMQAHLLANRNHVKDPAKVPEGSDLRYETGGHVRVGSVGVTWEY